MTAAILVMGLVTTARAEDWPQFRGPRNDGISGEAGLSKSWPEGGPPELWRVELGEGFSGISIVGGRAFTMFAVAKDEFVVCLDASTGKEIWRSRADDKWKDRFGNGPRSTPTVAGKTVFALSARGTLVALSVEDGKRLWVKDLAEEYDAKPPRWGFSGSPLVEGRALLVDVGGKEAGSVVAFDTATGKEIWRAQEDKAGYSTPLAVTIAGKRQVVFFTGTGVVSLAPADGSLLWRMPWKTSYDVNAATPVYIAPDKIFISSGYDVGGAVIRVKSSESGFEVEDTWKSREMKNKFSSSVLHGAHLYGFDESTLKCIDAGTGEMRWQARGLGHGSLFYADGHLVVLGDKGTLVLVEATPEEYREKARTQPFKGKTWTVPTLSDGRLYLRDEKEMIALDISG